MAVLSSLIQALYDSPLPTAVRESDYAFPVIQTFHVLGIVLMAGTISLVDLRILGVTLKRQSAAAVASSLLPITWIGFGIMVLSGGILFAAQSAKIYGNIFLQVKLALLVVAGLNVVLFHLATRASIAGWGEAPAPARARASAAASLALWAAVIVTGRYIAYY